MQAGDFDYDRGGTGYAAIRRPDPRIAEMIRHALGDAQSVLNVGAGAGSYEPDDRTVIALEPSATMRAQRPRTRPAVIGVAEALPFDDDSFDAAMACATVHQWRDLDRGLRELRRVVRGPVVILLFDPERVDVFWLAHYAPELAAILRTRDPSLSRVAAALGGAVSRTIVPIPLDCTDGFTEAFYGRPERLLEPEVRKAQSSWAFIEKSAQERAMAKLAADLASGAWEARWGALRTQPTFLGTLTLLVSDPRPNG